MSVALLAMDLRQSLSKRRIRKGGRQHAQADDEDAVVVTVTLNGLKSPGAVQALTSKSRRRAVAIDSGAPDDAPSAKPSAPAAAQARVVSEEKRQRLAEYRYCLSLALLLAQCVCVCVCVCV